MGYQRIETGMEIEPLVSDDSPWVMQEQGPIGRSCAARMNAKLSLS